MVYCGDLCKQVSGFVRYYQRKALAGELERPDIREALNTMAAHIASGGYKRRLRRLPFAVRRAVMERDNGECQICGAPGTSIDHMWDSSPDLANLRLLCIRCHMLVTALSMQPAPRVVVATVHRPLVARALASDHRQPCDLLSWDHRAWVAGASVAGGKELSLWHQWLDSAPDLDPAGAVAGFPSSLDPWLWYAGEPPEGYRTN
jgi:5-methylcytosine-specific restriction endonuclease McrA